jgi:hypothetical protein
MTREEYLRAEVSRAHRQFVGGSWAKKVEELRFELMTYDLDNYRSWPFVKNNLLSTSTPEVLHEQRQLVMPNGQRIRTLFEFGAGLLLHRFWVGDKYFVYDLPEMIALQRYIVGGSEPIFTSDLSAFLSLMRDNSAQFTAFVATWSLSECPISIRDLVLASAVEYCDMIFLAYQPVYDMIDNDGYFHAFAEDHQEFMWTRHDVEPPLDAGFYLIGRRNRWT